MKGIFINVSEKRLKSGWRILLFLILFVSLSNVIFFIKPLLGDITKNAFLNNYSLLIVIILSISATISTLISRKWLDKKRFTSLGLGWNSQSLKDLLFGFYLSFVMAACFFLLLLAFGLIHFNSVDFQVLPSESSFNFVQFMSVLTLGSLSIMLIEHIFVGYWEELVFRGYLFQNMVEGLGKLIAIIISCILYGLVHAANPNATLLSTLIIIGFGFLRLYGYLSTKILWLSMGMHMGWNFFQGPIFGFAASGHKNVTLIQHTFTSPKTYLTGGDFGPEGSILIIPILIITLLIMKWYANKYYPSKKLRYQGNITS